MLGGILQVDLLFTPEIQLQETVIAGVIPTVTHYRKGHYRIYPLADYIEELAAEHGMHQYETPYTVEYLTQLSDKILGQNVITWEGEHD